MTSALPLPGGYSITTVAGPWLDLSAMPSIPAIPFHQGPAIAKAGLNAVSRLRETSYRGRRLAAWERLAGHGRERDKHCLHLILHLGNCVHGAIRIQFFDREDPLPPVPPLYREILNRQPDGHFARGKIEAAILSMDSSKHFEISSWIVNPSVRACRQAAVILASAPFALGLLMAPFGGIFSARASNGASKVLEHFGCRPILHNGQPLSVIDPLYQGAVVFMTAHSKHHHPKLRPLVEGIAGHLRTGGFHLSSDPVPGKMP